MTYLQCIKRCLTAWVGLLLAASLCGSVQAQGYQQTNLVTDDQTNLSANGYAPAAHIDPTLINPWGISYSSGGPFWISYNGAGVSGIVQGDGTSFGNVGVPPPAGSSATSSPTGQVYNNTPGFHGDIFIFATEDGTISGWSGAANATLRVDNSNVPSAGSGAVYKGLALAGSSLCAANFRANALETYDSLYHQTSHDTDLDVPPGYAPFNVQTLGGTIYVTFALQNTSRHDDVAGPGHGFVDTYDPATGAFHRLISAGMLNSPWGLALAPSNFGQFSNDLLVGNFGDGSINAYSTTTGHFLGTLNHAHPLYGLWGLSFGNGGSGGDANKLYFTAGIGTPSGSLETHGLFGFLAVAPPIVLGSVSFSPSSVTGGASTTGTLTLSGPAPAGNAVVHLSSSNAAALYVPATAQLNAGLTSRTFAAVSHNVSAATTVTVTATYNGVSKTATVTVNPAPVSIKSVSFNPSTVTGGANATGTLTLTGPAPAGNAVVHLSSSNAAALYVPPTAQLSAGLTSRTFTAVSHNVSVATTVTVTASYNGVTQTATVTVHP